MGFSDSISITVDVEDWPQSTWDRSLPIGDYCAENTRRLLELFSEFPHTAATFFILGKFAEKHPAILREIQQAGHEIASHGYGHIETFRLTREEFKEDIIRSTAIIADAIGVRPIGSFLLKDVGRRLKLSEGSLIRGQLSALGSV